METILEEASRIVNGPRQANYNHPLDNFTGIAKLWSAYKGIDFTPEDVAILMILTKINRESFKPHRDNRVDIAGYIQCLDMLLEERDRRAAEYANISHGQNSSTARVDESRSWLVGGIKLPDSHSWSDEPPLSS